MGHRGKTAEGEGQGRPVPVGPLEEDAARGALFLPGQLLQPGGQAGKLGGEGVQRRLIGRRAGQVGAGAGRRSPAQLGPADVVVSAALPGPHRAQNSRPDSRARRLCTTGARSGVSSS